MCEFMINIQYRIKFMMNSPILLMFSYLFLTQVDSLNEQCSINENSSCKSKENGHKYTRDVNNKESRYMRELRRAIASYKPCQTANCSCHAEVIKADLEIFKTGITREDINAIKDKGTRYQIINHRLYREKECMFPARCSGIEHFLLKLVPILPDMEMIINTRDWPQISKHFGNKGPVFSFSKSNEYWDIMYPAWSFWEGGPAISLYPRGIGRWDKLRNSIVEAAADYPWKKKINRAFFRGSRTSSERDPLVLLSRENPDLVDAQYTKNQAWKSDADTLHATPAGEVSFEEHCKYKYLFNFRGVAASFRFKHLFLCKSVVFHVGNEWREFFYSSLKPWVHYIPVDVKATKDELKELIEFAINNDEIVRGIADRGLEMVWNNLEMEDVFCYWKKLLKKYAKLLKYIPELDLSHIEIKKP